MAWRATDPAPVRHGLACHGLAPLLTDAAKPSRASRGTASWRQARSRFALGRLTGGEPSGVATEQRWKRGLRAGGSAGLSDVLRGILLMCGGVSTFPFMNAAVKLLTAHYPAAQITWARFTGPPDRHAGGVPAALSVVAAADAAARGADRPLDPDAGEQSAVRHGDRQDAAGDRLGDRVHRAADRHRAVGAAAARERGMAAVERGAGGVCRRAGGDPAGQRILRPVGAAVAAIVAGLRAVPDRDALGGALRQCRDRASSSRRCSVRWR